MTPDNTPQKRTKMDDFLRYGAPKETTKKSAMVSPYPGPWNRCWQILCSARDKSGRDIPPPPNPQVLNGWDCADETKREVWQKTLDWADEYGYMHLIPDFPDDEIYDGTDLWGKKG
jgi:hypothetical protein